MNPTRIGIVLALIAIAAKLAFFYYNVGGSEQGSYIIFGHLLLILIAAFIPISNSPKEVDWIDMFKTGMRSVATYSVVYCVYLYFHYKLIDPMWFPERVDQIVSRYQEDQQAQVREFFTAFATPFKYATLTLLTFVVTGAFYTFLVTALERKVLRRFKR